MNTFQTNAMKFSTFTFSLFIACLLSCTPDKVIKLPITEKDGYGPFKSALRGISPYSEDENNPWKKTYLKISGAPENWSDIKFGDIDTDMYQSVYQNYYQGNITKERYEELKNSWDWKPDTLSLSKEPIKCKIAFAFGKDSTGETNMVIDANNNLDLSDDKIFKPINPSGKTNNDSLAITNSITVMYERFINNNVVKVSAPLLVVQMSQYDMFMCNFPQYATTKLNGEEIVISSDGFTNLSYKNPGIVLIDDSLGEGEKVEYEKIILKNEYIEIKDKIYKNLGVNRNENVLMLEKTDLPKDQLYSSQVGYKSFDFAGDDFKTKSSILSDSLKGKYVLLDFWAVWCGPCVQEFPNLKSLYGKVDKSIFEIIGIVGDSSSDALDKMLTKHAISWPQIVSDDTNKIKEKYGVHGYPTTFLLNPEGIIVAKNLRGKELEDKIISLIKK